MTIINNDSTSETIQEAVEVNTNSKRRMNFGEIPTQEEWFDIVNSMQNETQTNCQSTSSKKRKQSKKRKHKEVEFV